MRLRSAHVTHARVLHPRVASGRIRNQLDLRELTVFGWYSIGFGAPVLILMATTTRI